MNFNKFFEKSSIFRKNCEKPFVGENYRFEGKVASGDKINVALLVGNVELNIYHLTIFSKKKKSQITAKNNFNVTIFEGTARQMTKMNITFSVGNEVTNTAFKFFLQKHLYRLSESRETGFGTHFLLPPP